MQKLSDEKVREIRAHLREGVLKQVAIAKLVGVHESTVSRVKSRPEPEPEVNWGDLVRLVLAGFLHYGLLVADVARNCSASASALTSGHTARLVTRRRGFSRSHNSNPTSSYTAWRPSAERFNRRWVQSRGPWPPNAKFGFENTELTRCDDLCYHAPAPDRKYRRATCTTRHRTLRNF